MYIIVIGTHDIIDSMIIAERNLLITEYFNQSNASGAFFIFAFNDGGKLIMALDKNDSQNYLLSSVLSTGWYSMSVYDIEQDKTLLNSAVSYPADTSVFNIIGNGQGIGCTDTF